MRPSRRAPLRVLRRGDSGYESARKAMIWNRRTPPRFPDLIVRATTVADVVTALRLARVRDMRVSVRSGGHSFIGSPLRDGGMLIDLGALRGITIDTRNRTASVGPAITGGELAAALEKHDLGFPVGHCRTVAVGGYLLAGGLGWNSGQWGAGCLNVAAVEVVLASGEVVWADEARNPELFWAARGAGAGFPGIVTRFRLRAHPLPRAIKTTHVVRPLSALAETTGWVAEVAGVLPECVELAMRIAAVPIGSEDVSVLVTATAFAESDAEADDALAPLGAPATPTPISALHAWLDGYFPDDHRYATEAIWSDAEPVALLSVLGRHFAAAPSRRSLAVAVVGGPGGDVSPAPEVALSMTGRTFVGTYAIWADERDDGVNAEGHARMVRELEPLASGYYIGEADLSAPGRARDSFSPAAWRRLEDLRLAVDPDGMFYSLFEEL